MNTWLVKSEPDAFSWQQQVERGTEPWTGIRNHQAKRHLQAMRLGDLAFFYHSSQGREIVGIVEVIKESYSDPTAPTWACVDMRTVGPLPRPVTLADIRALPELRDMALVRQPRLSVAPVERSHWDRICTLGGWPR